MKSSLRTSSPRRPAPAADARVANAHARIGQLTWQVRQLSAGQDALRRGIRDEPITLVNTHVIIPSFANDALARLGLEAMHRRYIVGARVPVTVTVDAPDAGHAQRRAVAQIRAELRGLREVYLRRHAPCATPAEDPAREAVVAVRAVRVAAHPHHPGVARYAVSAHVLLAIRATCPRAGVIWPTACQRITADLQRLRLTFVAVHTHRIDKSWVRAAGGFQPTLGLG